LAGSSDISHSPIAGWHEVMNLFKVSVALTAKIGAELDWAQIPIERGKLTLNPDRAVLRITQYSMHRPENHVAMRGNGVVQHCLHNGNSRVCREGEGQPSVVILHPPTTKRNLSTKYISVSPQSTVHSPQSKVQSSAPLQASALSF
jgi:hypothetical protein